MLSRHPVEGPYGWVLESSAHISGNGIALQLQAARKKVGSPTPVLTGQTEEESGEIDVLLAWSDAAVRSELLLFQCREQSNQGRVHRES
jgi:hypothetical protein